MNKASHSVDESHVTPLKKVERVDDPRINDQTFRNGVIEEGEKDWNTAKQEKETIAEEKKLIEERLALYAPKIEAGIRNRKQPLSSPAELPHFLKECGLSEAKTDEVRIALTSNAEGVKPMHVHLKKALFEAINGCILADEPEAFVETTLIAFGAGRGAEGVFLKDQTAHIKYRDKQGLGWYRTEEGMDFMRSKLNPQQEVEHKKAA